MYSINPLNKTSPRTSLCQKVSPCLRVKELCPEHWSKVLVLKVWWIVFLHELYKVWCLIMLPAVPKPFCSITWYWVQPPMHKNTKLSLVVPWGEGTRVQWFPCWLIFTRTQHQGNKGKGKDELYTIHFQLIKSSTEVLTSRNSKKK